MRRLAGGVEREADGTWIIAPDHLDKAAMFERNQAKDAPVMVHTLSSLPLDRQVGADGATWLDRELVAANPEPLRESGFGREVRDAGQLSRELGLDCVETANGDRVEGVYRRAVDLASCRFAIIEKTREFTLVPWRPVLERHLGKQVSGIMRGEGISWTIARQRGGPSV